MLLSDTLRLSHLHMIEKVITLNKTIVKKCQGGFNNIERSEFSKKVQSLLILRANNVTVSE